MAQFIAGLLNKNKQARPIRNFCSPVWLCSLANNGTVSYSHTCTEFESSLRTCSLDLRVRTELTDGREHFGSTARLDDL